MQTTLSAALILLAAATVQAVAQPSTATSGTTAPGMTAPGMTTPGMTTPGMTTPGMTMPPAGGSGGTSHSAGDASPSSVSPSSVSPSSVSPSSGSPSSGSPSSVSPSTGAFRQANRKMMHGMMVPMSGDPDRDFVAGMLPHHQGAVDMAKVELQYGKDPEMRQLATDIVGAQEKEIGQMKVWQAKHPATH
jgi:hypothetical protein